MFTPDFIGNAQGEVGEPWLTAGIYDPQAQPFRSESEFDPNNPFDLPRTIHRAVVQNSPFAPADDQRLLAAQSFQDFDTLMQTSSHNDGTTDGGFYGIAMGWIGGTLAMPYTAFRDPFVFLLLSNIDRLFAAWQNQPGHPERHDPNNPQGVYGAYYNSTGSGDVQSGRPSWGILSPLEPWAGPNAQNSGTGIIMNVPPIRPWAPPENEVVSKDSRDPNSRQASSTYPCLNTF